MADDSEWVQDVRRWVSAGARSGCAAPSTVGETDDGDVVGYEAAHPALQAAHWPDAAGPEAREPV